MSESMLEITLRVMDKRRKEITDCPINQKLVREYFEEGCLCVLNGDIHCPPDQPDDVANVFYMMWCGCSRHYDSTLRYNGNDLR